MLRLVLEPTGPLAARTDLAGLTAQLDRLAPGDLRVIPAADRLPRTGRASITDRRSITDQLEDLRSAFAAADDILVMAADAVLPDAALRLVIGSAGPATLVHGRAGRHPVATSGGVVASVATAVHPLRGADADGLGVLFVPAASAFAARAALNAATLDLAAGDALDGAAIDGPEIDRVELDGATPATVDRTAVESAELDVPAAERVGAWTDVDLADLLLTVLVRGSVPVAAVPIEPFPGGRCRDAAETAALTASFAGIDEAALTSRRSSRPDDGFYSTFVLRRMSRPISRWGAAHGVSANAVTGLSGVLGAVAAVGFGTGDRAGLLAGALLLQVSLVLDCVDGEIARTTRTFSAFGAWLDASLDRVKEYGALAGLAVGLNRDGHDLWLVALAAMVVQTARHVEDFSFDKGVLAAWRAPRVDRRPLTDHTPWARPPGSAPPAVRTTSVSDWVRRIIHMPIAERWLVLSLGAALDRPAWSLVAYLALTAAAAAWTLAGALRRSLHSAVPYPAGLPAAMARYRDDGLLGLLLRGRPDARGSDPGGRGLPGGTAGWLIPVVVTAVEGAVLVVATLTTGAGAGHDSTRAWAFAWFAVVAWHRYDLIYRWRDRGLTVPVWVDAAGGGWLVRSAVVAVAALFGGLTPVLIVGTFWLAVGYIPESLLAGARSWRGRHGAVTSASTEPAGERA